MDNDKQVENIDQGEPQGLVPVDINYLLTKAIEKDISVEAMERLFALRDKMLQEQAKQAFDASFERFQAACPTIKKTKKVHNKNNKYMYSYAPLEVIERQIGELMKEHGFSYVFKDETKEPGKGYLTIACHIKHVMGHVEKSCCTMPVDKQAYMNNLQQVNSARTYAKRSAFCDAFGLTAEDDDDGNYADDTGNYVEPRKPQEVKQTVGNKVDISKISDENKMFYQKSMRAINARESGVEIFQKGEKEDLVKGVNACALDLGRLKKFYASLQSEVEQRRLKIKEVNKFKNESLNSAK